MEKLSSGLRINRAGDDAAGLAISEKMRAQIRGLNQASRNAQDGISMIQTAEGALSETQAISQRMRELAIQSANGTYTDEDRKLINQEFGQLKKEIDRIASDTEFNGSKVLNGEKSGKDIQFSNGTITVKKGTNKDQFNQDKVADIMAGTELSSLNSLGEGKFHLKFTRDNNNDDVTIELIDESKFNDGKKYVIDSQIIKGGANDEKVRTVTLAGAEFKFGKLKANMKTINMTEFNVELNNAIDSETDGVKLQVGANQEQMIGVSIQNMRSRELGLGGIEVGTVEDAQEAITRVDEAISRISSQRADLGATQNRLEHTIAQSQNPKTQKSNYAILFLNNFVRKN